MSNLMLNWMQICRNYYMTYLKLSFSRYYCKYIRSFVGRFNLLIEICVLSFGLFDLENRRKEYIDICFTFFNSKQSLTIDCLDENINDVPHNYYCAYIISGEKKQRIIKQNNIKREWVLLFSNIGKQLKDTNFWWINLNEYCWV